jgi:threonine dehydrogenase-like Zn-dependent dehydrogenase
MLDLAVQAAPSRSQIVVVGVCMQSDTFEPTVAITKQLTLTFVLGWSAAEFADCLESIGSGRIDVSPLITGKVDLTGTPAAFDDLANPERHAKILVLPGGAT